MRKDICLFVILSALMLTSVGGWTVFAISHVKAAFVKAANDTYRSTTIGGGLYFVPPPAY
jgi:hypothetical protein